MSIRKSLSIEMSCAAERRQAILYLSKALCVYRATTGLLFVVEFTSTTNFLLCAHWPGCCDTSRHRARERVVAPQPLHLPRHDFDTRHHPLVSSCTSRALLVRRACSRVLSRGRGVHESRTRRLECKHLYPMAVPARPRSVALQ